MKKKNKNFQLDKKYFKIAIYILGVVLIAIFFEKILDNVGPIAYNLGIVFTAVKAIILPFVFGFFIAFVLNPLMIIVEKKVVKGKFFESHRKFRRNTSIFVCYLLTLGFVIIVMAFFIPELFKNINNFLYILPENISVLEDKLNLVLSSTTFARIKDIDGILNYVLGPLLNVTKDSTEIIQAIVLKAMSAASSAFNFVLGIFIAFYMLAEKEIIISKLKKILFAFLSEKKANIILDSGNKINKVFKEFIIGKAIDSLIIGIICFIGLSVMEVPYPLMLSVVIGVTNMIPYFGPFIGAIPSVIIVFLMNPILSLWVALFLFALQQFDGIFLGPKILGSTIGLSPIWIIFSVFAGGAIAGPIGMFLGVPFFATIKIFGEAFVDIKYEERKLKNIEQTKDKKKEDDYYREDPLDETYENLKNSLMDDFDYDD